MIFTIKFIQIREFRNLVVDAREGDNLFLYCKSIREQYFLHAHSMPVSGHGTQVKDLDGDEIDGKDEGNLFRNDDYNHGD